MDEGHEGDEDDDLHHAVEHVEALQVEAEVLVVRAAGDVEERHRRELRGEQHDVEADDVKGQYDDHGGDQPGRHQVPHRRQAHDLDGVDLVGDTHGPELGGELGADLGGEDHAADQGGDLPDAGVSGDEAHQVLGTDELEALGALQAGLDADHRGHHHDDDHGSRANDVRAGADGDVADVVGDHRPVLQRCRQVEDGTARQTPNLPGNAEGLDDR